MESEQSVGVGESTRARIYRLLRENQDSGKRPLTYREMAERLRLGSTQTVFTHVRQLIKEGKVIKLSGTRGLYVRAAGNVCPVCHGSGRI